MHIIFSCGINDDGQCGKAIRKHDKPQLQQEIHIPAVIKFPQPNTRITAISAGSRHSLALSSDGVIYAWGWGRVGQLGLGDTYNSAHPTPINSLVHRLVRVASISAGGMHSACIDTDNRVYTWGSASCGQLGLGKESAGEKEDSCINIPTQVTLESNSNEVVPLLATKVSCGGLHSAAVGLKGELYCWGKSDSGQTGFSTWYLDFAPSVFTPKLVSGLPAPAIDVSCGGFYTLVLTSMKVVYAMGKEDFGCLGTGIETSNMSIGMETPTLVQSLVTKEIASISAGGWHSFFVSSEGDIFGCGKGEYGRLGSGGESAQLQPTLISEALDGGHIGPVVQVSAGGSHTILRTADNQVYTAGRVDGGRCGVGIKGKDRIQRFVDVSKNIFSEFEKKILDVSAGGAHSLILVDYPEIDVGNDETAIKFISSVENHQLKLSY